MPLFDILLKRRQAAAAAIEAQRKRHAEKPLLISEAQAINVVCAFNAAMPDFFAEYRLGFGFSIVDSRHFRLPPYPDMDAIHQQFNEIAKKIIGDDYIDWKPDQPTQFSIWKCRVGKP